MSVFAFLRNAAGERSLHGATGRWRQAVSLALDALTDPVPLSRVLYVDGIRALAAGDGAIGNPYSTIQEALTFIGPPANQTEKDTYWTIYVINGATPENLTIPPQRRIEINVRGGPTSVQSITWADNVNVGTGIASSQLTLSGFMTVLGNITISDAGTATFGNLILEDMFVFGNILATAYVTGTLLLDVDGCGLVGDINAPATGFTTCTDSELFGNVTVKFFDLVALCVLGEPTGSRTWTVTQSATRGFIGCRFTGSGAGTFTISGPASTARMDGTSNFFFKAGGVGALAGGSTKVIMDDLVP